MGKEILKLAEMIHALYAELDPLHVSGTPRVFIDEAVRCLEDPKQFVHITDKGFFIVVDETEAMTPTKLVYNGTRVYVKPEFRNGRVLKEFYDIMFDKFPNGTIVGVTDINSKHIAVLEKRHTRIANVYKLERN